MRKGDAHRDGSGITIFTVRAIFIALSIERSIHGRLGSHLMKTDNRQQTTIPTTITTTIKSITYLLQIQRYTMIISAREGNELGKRFILAVCACTYKNNPSEIMHGFFAESVSWKWVSYFL